VVTDRAVRPLEEEQRADVVDVEALFRTHRRRLFELAVAITMDRGTADEVVQDAFAGLHVARNRVDIPAAYLQRAVVNGSINALRRRRTRNAAPLPPAGIASTPQIDETWRAVSQLPSRQRAVVVLRFWQDMTLEDIAATLGWPKGTVKSTLHRALQKLEKELIDDVELA
jgi:RNA polymerase sigma-70 factor (sigma-E family)